MNIYRNIGIPIVMCLLIISCQQKTLEEKLAIFFSKENVKILVTDSGLGGVSVAADVVARIGNAGVFKEVDVIFFNAQPHINSGYNSMRTTEQKVTVFNNALEAMAQNFEPDLLLIACNTLSVLYDYTEFSKQTEIPVIGIVETGVDLIEQKLVENKKAKAVIFATKTTVGQGKHKVILVERGVPEENILTQACPHLAGEIERGTQSDTTISLISKYVDTVADQLAEDTTDIYVSYNCTHYGYVDDLFQKAFSARQIKIKEFLDPNPYMANFIFQIQYLNRYPETHVTAKLVSQPELSPDKLASIHSLIEPVSPLMAQALLDYEFKPDCFAWRSVVEEKE